MSRPGRRPTLAEQVATGAELVVLADGPWAGRWYWAEDLAAMQRAARRYRPTDAAGQLQNYQRGTDHAPHPSDPKVTGLIYRYRPPTPVTTSHNVIPTPRREEHRPCPAHPTPRVERSAQ